MAFTERVDAHRQTVHDRFSDDILVVAAERTRAELAALEDRVSQHMRAQRQQASPRERRLPEPGTIS
jgi:CRISPR/Cas system type I-B associated protein Csh2 (Cas7 group RAMP superfamily)